MGRDSSPLSLQLSFCKSNVSDSFLVFAQLFCANTFRVFKQSKGKILSDINMSNKKQSNVHQANATRFDKTLFETLKFQAETSARRRAHFNVHKTYQDVVQRLFIAMMPDSYVRPHRHVQSHKWEFFMVLEGQLDILFFDNEKEGQLVERITLKAGGETSGVEIPPNVWHATVCNSPVVFMEVKQGPYEATDDKGFAPWSPEEGSHLVPQFLNALKRAEEGDLVGVL